MAPEVEVFRVFSPVEGPVIRQNGFAQDEADIDLRSQFSI